MNGACSMTLEMTSLGTKEDLTMRYAAEEDGYEEEEGG